MKSVNTQNTRKLLLIILCSFSWIYNNAQVNSYSDCVEGISYYIQTDDNHNATITIDMNQAHHNVYLNNIACYFYPIDLNMNKLSSDEMEYDFKTTGRLIGRKYVTVVNAKLYNNADGMLGTKITCDCQVAGAMFDRLPGAPPPPLPKIFKNGTLDGSNNNPAFIKLLGAFTFPGAGEKNSNGAIGDFCCTGETATVLAGDNSPIGYIYNYDFKGGYNISDNQSIATQFSILVSGISDINNNQCDRIKQSVDFTTGELYEGSVKSVQAGALSFRVTILDVSKYSDPKYYLMGTVKTKVEVSTAVN